MISERSEHPLNSCDALPAYYLLPHPSTHRSEMCPGQGLATQGGAQRVCE